MEVPQRPSPAQGRSGNCSAELSPSASPQEPDPTNSTSKPSPNSSPAACSRHSESAPSEGTDAPRLSCAAGVRGAQRGHAGDGQNPRPSESDAGRGPAATFASPLGHGPAGLRPTHPARWRAGRGPKRAYSPAPALTHLSASPCRRARRCRVPLCTLRTQTNPPPAPVPPPASP